MIRIVPTSTWVAFGAINTGRRLLLFLSVEIILIFDLFCSNKCSSVSTKFISLNQNKDYLNELLYLSWTYWERGDVEGLVNNIEIGSNDVEILFERINRNELKFIVVMISILVWYLHFILEIQLYILAFKVTLNNLNPISVSISNLSFFHFFLLIRLYSCLNCLSCFVLNIQMKIIHRHCQSCQF